MSTFSEHLNELIQKKNLTLPYLEKESGLSTALISKIKTGKRLPDSEEKMIKLIQALHCSTEKEKELIKEYRIDKMGRDKYLCMEEIRRTLESLSHYSPHIAINKKTEYNVETKQFIFGENNLKTMIQYIIEEEISNNCNYVKILLQPEYPFLEDFLIQAVANTNMQQLYLEHIVALCEPDTEKAKRKNIKISNTCLRLASIYGVRYRAHYSYKTEFTTDFFPYCILTSQHALLISADYQHALFIREESTLNALNQMFENLKRKCRPLFRIAEDPIGYLQGYDEYVWSGNLKAKMIIQLAYFPCILPVIPPEIALNRMNPELKKVPYIMDYLKRYWTELSINKEIAIFSIKGLEFFMQTGFCYELPKGCCDSFSLDERIAIINAFIRKAEKGEIVPLLANENQLKLSPALMITMYHSHVPVLMWNLPDLPFCSCFVQEDSIRNSIAEFLEYIQENDGEILSPEESLSLIKDFMKQYS